MRRYQLALLPVLALISSACFCQYDPYAHLFTTQQPPSENVVGVYILKEQTLSTEGLSFLQGQPATIELNSNGTYTATNFLLWKETGAAEYKFDSLLSMTGNWKIKAVGTVSGGDEHTASWGIVFDPVLDDSVVNLTNNEPPHGLIFTYGDPDSGDVMIFEKTQLMSE